AVCTVVLLLVISNGGINSTFFYLFYFMAFGIALVFEPPVVFVFSIATIFLFLPDALANDAVARFIKLGSLLLLTPVAYFFGQNFRKEEEQAQYIEKTKGEAKQIQQDAQEILVKNRKNLKS